MSDSEDEETAKRVPCTCISFECSLESYEDGYLLNLDNERITSNETSVQQSKYFPNQLMVTTLWIKESVFPIIRSM